MKRTQMKGLWVPVSAAISQQKQVDTIANNVANTNTAGFKKDQQVFKEYLSAFEGKDQEIDMPLREWKPDDFYRSFGAEKAMVKVDGTFTSFEQGQLTPTDNPLDLAIRGQGLFEVLSPQGGVRYTRRGQFSVDQDGYLVSHDGAKLLKTVPVPDPNAPKVEGAPTQPPPIESRFIKIDATKRASINQQGEIYQDGLKVDQISVAEFNDINALKKEGSSYFVNQFPENQKVAIENSNVLQGFVEESNVNPITEMANLIQAHRNFESIQRVIKTYDAMAGKGATEISRF